MQRADHLFKKTCNPFNELNISPGFTLTFRSLLCKFRSAQLHQEFVLSNAKRQEITPAQVNIFHLFKSMDIFVGCTSFISWYVSSESEAENGVQ